MNQPKTENLEDLASHVVEHLLPEIHASVETCVEAYRADTFNDSWTFGTQFWKNLWNRFSTVAELEDCPFEEYGGGNEYKLRIGKYIVRQHRVNNKTKMPTGAKAVKKAAEQMDIYSLLGGEVPKRPQDPSVDNIVIGINVTTSKGLLEVFVGELRPVPFATNKYEWAEKAPVFLADGQTPYAEQYEHIPSGATVQVPMEQMAEPVTRLHKIVRKKKKSGNSDQ